MKNDIQIIKDARLLADYISASDLDIIDPNNCYYKDHIGALFTDVILQAGLNYKYVVFPRVNYILKNYPMASTVFLFWQLLNSEGYEKV
ncbi:hypothetical protein LJB95_03030 [Paludibacteraceae bacterium OttesenSCG-928-F17]|nr:hypothetical protein [Paludibacteraceae bacterium OttesenSCG-928-F17]